MCGTHKTGKAGKPGKTEKSREKPYEAEMTGRPAKPAG